MAHDRLHSCFVCQIRCFKFKKKMLFRTHGYINLFVVSHTGRGREGPYKMAQGLFVISIVEEGLFEV